MDIGSVVNKFRLEEFDSIPTKKGIYSWHILTSNWTNDLTSYHKVFCRKTLDIKIKGNFAETYQTSTKLQELNFDRDFNDPKVLSEISQHFCPPIYIGISLKSLRYRLNQHKKQLINFVSLPSYLESEIEKMDTDTHFAYRVGEMIRSFPDITEANMFVKTFIFPDGISKKEAEDIEFFFNRTYRPLFGKK